MISSAAVGPAALLQVDLMQVSRQQVEDAEQQRRRREQDRPAHEQQSQLKQRLPFDEVAGQDDDAEGHGDRRPQDPGPDLHSPIPSVRNRVPARMARITRHADHVLRAQAGAVEDTDVEIGPAGEDLLTDQRVVGRGMQKRLCVDIVASGDHERVPPFAEVGHQRTFGTKGPGEDVDRHALRRQDDRDAGGIGVRRRAEHPTGGRLVAIGGTDTRVRAAERVLRQDGHGAVGRRGHGWPVAHDRRGGDLR